MQTPTQYKLVDVSVNNPDGTVVFEQKNVEVPIGWSETATKILAQKYFRKRGIPTYTQPMIEDDVPEFLFQQVPVEGTVMGGETSIRQVSYRLAGAWTYWGWKQGHFIDEDNAQAWMNNIIWMIENQVFAPNSPQWFNTGLHWAYGIKGTSQGHYAENMSDLANTPDVVKTSNAFERPQASACFIQSVKDDLVGEGGIMDTLSREARLFKFGSGSGSNFSRIRGKGESLAGGGTSSGLLSFLKIGDTAAGSIKSGGTTRRAAKMVSLDVDHPDIEEFVTWKVREEDKVSSLATGSATIHGHLENMKAAWKNSKGAFATAVQDALAAKVPEGYIERVVLALQQDIPIDLEAMSVDWQSPAYETVSGQNSNNTVRVSDEFLNAVNFNRSWDLTARTDGSVMKTVKARQLMDTIAYSAWACADPGMHYKSVIDHWHTCPNDGEIRGSNPCSEYLFLDDTACNLASLNLVKFLREDGSFDLIGYEEACEAVQTILDITVGMASYPTQTIAKGSFDYRTTGIGYANLGGLLMRMGIPYDSDAGRFVGGALYSMMTAVAYRTSSHLATDIGQFSRYQANKEPMMRVIRQHYDAASNTEHELKGSLPLPNVEEAIDGLYETQRRIWSEVVDHGQVYGFRNAQVSVAAPTGTIGMVMDCDTTGIEPDFALVKGKSLAGGGWLQIINQGIPAALKRLGYEPEVAKTIEDEIMAGTPVGDIIALSEEHKSVFHCANDISYKGHMDMISVCQQFVSGSLSKTVNMPANTTVEQIRDVYLYGRDIGLKAISIYRDSSKLSQPLSGASALGNLLTQYEELKEEEEVQLPDILQGVRIPMPNIRPGHTAKFSVSGHTVYLRTGEYESGRLGEIFISMYKEGVMTSAVLNAFAISTSLGLQYGVPLEEYVDAYVHTKFEPSGPVRGHDNIKMCSSILDVMFRHLALYYLGRTDLVQVKPDTMTIDKRDKPRVSAVPEAMPVDTINAPVTGNICGSCGSANMIKNGTCELCRDCGETTGCS